MAETTRTPQAAAQPSMPLLYQDLQLLNLQQHADWRLKDGDFRFAGEAIAVPIVVGEFTAVLRNYPILFAAAGEDVSPIALLGLEQANLYVDEGRWEQGAYIPAYVRRYPFGFMSHAGQFALAIDAASGRFVRGGSEGVALFEQGKPSAITRDSLRFCESVSADAAATQEFCRALKSKQLLVDRRASATLPGGRQFGLEGFQIVDASKFGALDDATVLDWHKMGYLALVHFHLASLERFEQLLIRRNARDAVAGNAGEARTQGGGV